MENLTPGRKCLFVTPNKTKSISNSKRYKSGSSTPRKSETPKIISKALLVRKGKSKFTHNKDGGDDHKICVCVRVRPLSKREKNSGSLGTSIILEGCEIHVRANVSKELALENHSIFCYDHVFDSTQSEVYDQKRVFETIATPLLDASMEGYNACLFAYGQTGSGKTFSMMDADGTFSDEGIGIIPRFCKELINRKCYSSENYSISISYFEIYNEKIYDLLSNIEQKTSLKVREHPNSGPYVADLTFHAIETFDTCMSLLLLGNSRKITGATLNNERSSRSHTIFEIVISHKTDEHAIFTKTSLVDLAGSERVTQCSLNEERFKEGLSINKSLLTLGKVISCLADKKKGCFVPYRDSLLTWLLKESLGGNSRTTMLATVSPSSASFDETLSTLRWAHKARRIVCTTLKNEDPHLRLVKDLQNEVQRLKALRDNIETRVRSPGHSAGFSANDTALEIERKQRTIEAQLQKELAKLGMHLDAAEKRKKELVLQRNVILQETANQNIPAYETNFFDNLKNILNTSLNESQTSDISEKPIYSNCALEKQRYLYKMKYFTNLLESVSKKGNSANSQPELVLISEIQLCISKLYELNNNIVETVM